MFQMSSRTGLFGLLLLCTTQLSACYVCRQGYEQLRLLSLQQPVAEILSDSRVPEAIREKLRLIHSAKKFAEDSVGLRVTRNYQTYVPLQRDAVTYVVSAAYQDRLVPYEWWFPIVGHVPYKGFFERESAVAEQASLEESGLDTSLRGVSAFSLLGFLPDPVYQPFLNHPPATLVNVVIHEITHATVFIAGEASFNEGFATFVGNQGALDFFQAQGATGAALLRETRAAQGASRQFSVFIQQLKKELNTLYTSALSTEEKHQKRRAIFLKARERAREQASREIANHALRHFAEGTVNNATLLAYGTYYEHLDDFERAHERLGGNLRATVTFFRDVVARQPAPGQYLRLWLRQGASGSGLSR